MNVIVCLSDDNGMLFNNRRQSRDIEVLRRLEKLTENHRLFINDFSADLFVNNQNVTVNNNFLDVAQFDDFCFVENVSLLNYKHKINKIYIYKWNRKYPADVYFDVENFLFGYKLVSSVDFKGNSHSVITEEIYKYEDKN